MADANGAAQAAQTPTMKIRSQYVKDLSFENIAAQKQVANATQPEIKVGVNLDAKKRTDTDFEVVMSIEVRANAGEEPIFLMEMDYAGLFFIENVPQEQLHPFLMIECPRMLFPFVRRIVGDVTRDGGFPPVNVDNIDFLALYRNEVMRRQAAQQEAASADSAES
ncbi:MAG: protein-export chaperone SecB [Pseudomonadota bacterium]